MTILFIGDLNANRVTRSFQRFRALRLLGHAVTGISLTRSDELREFLFEKALAKFGFPSDTTGANKEILTHVKQTSFDIIWIEKGNSVWPSTLRSVKMNNPEASIISIAEDDMFLSHNHSYYYTNSLYHYDLVFTTKERNVQELKTLGAKRVEVFLDAYDKTYHRPISLLPEDREQFGAEVGFVGTFERERAKSMLFLAEHGVAVTIWGNGWGAWRNTHKNLIIKNGPVYGDNYIKVVAATKVNLSFLRKLNRDVTTSRSVEIPACGAFLLTERTDRHSKLFTEGSEVAFFASNQELLEKTSYYLLHEKERNAIAAAGKKRCEISGFEIEIQLQAIIHMIRPMT